MRALNFGVEGRVKEEWRLVCLFDKPTIVMRSTTKPHSRWALVS